MDRGRKHAGKYADDVSPVSKICSYRISRACHRCFVFEKPDMLERNYTVGINIAEELQEL